MHNLYFGIVNKEDASTSLEAREYLHNWLNENWFVWEGFYSCWKCDWFVIGWRWNWLLQEMITWEEHYDKDSVYNDYWTEYDAMEWTNKLLDKLKENYWDVEVVDTYEEHETTIDKLENIDDDWIVVVDYHS